MYPVPNFPNEWERDSLLMGKNGASGITWVLTRPVRPTRTPFVGAHAHKDKRGPIDCSIYDHGDFCLYCVGVERVGQARTACQLRAAPREKLESAP